MSTETFVTILTVQSEAAAELIRARLEENGIACAVSAQSLLLPVPVPLVHIQVRRGQAEQAGEILRRDPPVW